MPVIRESPGGMPGLGRFVVVERGGGYFSSKTGPWRL
jgi:hypothetical protein